jgi:hypothetical protein
VNIISNTNFDSKLSQAIRDDTTSIRDQLPVLQSNTIAIKADVDMLRAGTQAIKDDTESIQASTLAIRDAQTMERHRTIMQWLSPTDYPTQQHDIITRRQEGTGEWFLESPEFQKWLQGSDKTLFCPGIPGAGKTMMSAIAIDHICKTAWNESIGVAYLFCNYKTQGDQSALSLLSALLKQLVQGQPDMATPITSIYDYHTRRNTRPSLNDIFRILQSVCSNYTAIYIVVDALDECADRDGARSRLVNKLDELQTKSDVRLMYTSRFIPEIMQKFVSHPLLEIRASPHDVRRFVEGRIPYLPKCIQRDDDLKRTIQDKVVEAVDGMYVLFTCVMHTIQFSLQAYQVPSRTSACRLTC